MVGRWPCAGHGQSPLAEEYSVRPRGLATDDNGAHLNVFEHLCKHVRAQSEHADAIIYASEQSVHSVAIEAMARIGSALRGADLKQAPAAVAFASQSKDPSHLLPTSKLSASSSSGTARTTLVLAGAGQRVPSGGLHANTRGQPAGAGARPAWCGHHPGQVPPDAGVRMHKVVHVAPQAFGPASTKTSPT
jgi:hypothetical protein